MSNVLRSLFVLIAVPLAASATTEEIIDRHIDAAPGQKLVVEVDFGKIDVASGADDKVVIEAHRRIDFGDESKEKEYIANAPVNITREGNVVTVRSHGKSITHWNCEHQTTEASYTIRVPKKFETALRTGGGAINISNIAGDSKAHTSGGRMRFAHLEGTVDAETSGGAIDIDDCQGPIAIETSGGYIRVTDSKGSLRGKTSGGHIEVRNFTGDADVRTTGGALELEKISGKLVGITSGGGIRASMPGAVNGDVRLETTAGSIQLWVPASAGLAIDAKTSVGAVISRLPIQASDANREHLRGMMNGGGKAVRLETSAGDIVLEPARQEVANR